MKICRRGPVGSEKSGLECRCPSIIKDALGLGALQLGNCLEFGVSACLGMKQLRFFAFFWGITSWLGVCEVFGSI